MGKRTLHPMDDFRRQKRKKEVAKNKTARISARDERVKETKTVREVEEAIRGLEARGVKTPAEQQKLQRLQKELKLVLAEKAAKADNSKVHLPPHPVQLTELDDPRKSVYYDEMLNPYGAPPPGKPRLYHRRGGGETIDAREAAVPSEQDSPTIAELKPPPPKARELPILQFRRPPYQDQRSNTSAGIQLLSSNPRQPQEQYRPPLPPPPLPLEHKPSIPPPLPAPSAAVLRTKRTIAADIWASTEEVSYERNVKCNDLEDSFNTGGWWYRDSVRQVQGPFTREQILDWSRGGFFPPDTPVKQGEKGKWWIMGDVDWTTGERKGVKSITDGVDERISSLRKNGNGKNGVNFVKDNRKRSDEGEGDEINARIEALKQLLKTQNDECDAGLAGRIEVSYQERKSLAEQDDDSGVADRIDALRKASDHRLDDLDGTGGLDSSLSPDPLEHATDDSIETPHTVNLRHLYEKAGTNSIVELPVYPIEEPALFPIDDMVYPIDDALMIDVHGVPSYPMGAYPADMTYPPDGDYPVMGVYGDSDDADDVGTSAPLKQLVVPGLIPSHLQRRKSRTKVVPKRKPPPGTVKEASKSVANDYDKFMEEISGFT